MSRWTYDAFLVRPSGGWSLGVCRLGKFNQLPEAERLILSILRADWNLVGQVLSEADRSPTILAEFINYLKVSQLATALIETICRHENQGILAKLDLLLKTSRLETLSSLSNQEMVRHLKWEAAFDRLLGLVGDLGSDLVFVKGAVLNQTIYKGFAPRSCSDFDAIIAPDKFGPLCSVLVGAGYRALDTDPGFCHKFMLSPLRSFSDFELEPLTVYDTGAVLSFSRGDDPLLDLKFDPFERGVKMAERARFWRNLEKISASQDFYAPSKADHLLLCASHFAKHSFQGHRWLLDLHLLFLEIYQGGNWEDLAELARLEALCLPLWLSLSMCRDRLGTPVPDAFLEDLQSDWEPTIAIPSLSFVVNPTAHWALSSLPMLVANALATEDRIRKFSYLRQVFFPSAAFLRSYYRVRSNKESSLILALIMHWIFILLPGGLIRRSFGKLLPKLSVAAMVDQENGSKGQKIDC